MRTLYLIETLRRRRGAAAADLLASQPAQGARRVRRKRLLAALALVLTATAVGLWAWQLFAPPPPPEAAGTAEVPAHQRSGPLANPWGDGPPVLAEGAAAGAAASAAAAAASAAESAPAHAGASAPAPTLDTPAARVALRAALANLRASARAADFVATAVQGSDPAALVVAWMAERQCRQVTLWRQMMEWRQRANSAARGDAPAGMLLPGASAFMRSTMQRCEGLPDDTALDAALAAAGFAANAASHENIRRPLDLTHAAALGDAVLLTTVLDATPLEELVAWVAARTKVEPDTSADVLRSALWLASCLNAESAGVGVRRAACQEHPALWQACMNQGLCDARDVNDLLLRTLPADAMHASGRLARALAPHLGAAETTPRSQR